MKVLLLAHAFPPFNASGAVRAAKLAEHLQAKGHDVRVLTAAPQALPPTLETSFPRRNVLTTAWWRVEAPLDALRARIGARIRQQAANATTSGSASETRGRSRAERAVMAYRSIVAIPDAQVGWIRAATNAGRQLFVSWRPDLIYSTALPFSSHVVAARLARAAGCPWVGEYRDLFSGNPYSDLWPSRVSFDRRLEQRVMRTASAIVSISAPLSDYLSELHGKPVATIMNGYDAADLARAPDMSRELEPAKVSIIYTGILYPGRRDPAVLFEALRRLGAARQRFNVRFYGPALEAVTDAARRHGVDDVVRTFEPVPHLEALGLQKAADVLLLLLWNNPLEKGVLTGKLFEYAGSGRPVLSLGCTDGAAADLIRERRLGIATVDVQETVRFLDGVLGQKQAGFGPDATRTAPAVHGLSRREQFEELERFLAGLQLLSAPAPS